MEGDDQRTEAEVEILRRRHRQRQIVDAERDDLVIEGDAQVVEETRRPGALLRRVDRAVPVGVELLNGVEFLKDCNCVICGAPPAARRRSQG